MSNPLLWPLVELTLSQYERGFPMAPCVEVKEVFSSSYLLIRGSEAWCYRNLIWAPKCYLHKDTTVAIPVLLRQA